MKIGLTISVGIAVSLLIANVCFADVVYFANGFTYEGEVKQDAQKKGYWVDGAFVSEKEIKKIEGRETLTATAHTENEEKKWHEKLALAGTSFKKSFQAKMKEWFKDDSAPKYTAVSKPGSVTYTHQSTTPAQKSTNYSGSAKSVWQSIRRSTSTGKGSNQYNNAGSIAKRERNQSLQELKRNSAAYDLKNERTRNKSALSYSKQNSAGYALSRQRAQTDRELSSFGGNY